MLDFFIALFGGAYLAGRYGTEKHSQKLADQRTQEWINKLNSDYNLWVSRVVDDELEYKVNHCSADKFQAMRENVRRETGIDNVADDIVIMGLLAQKAKIPRKIAIFGIRSFGLWDYEERQKWQSQRKLLTWYDKELRRNGLQEPLLFVDGNNAANVRHNINLASPITATSHMVGGTYFWAPMRGRIF